MHLPLVPPRFVEIGDAAFFAGTTPEAIRRYHDAGLLPEPTEGSKDRRRYGYEDMIRLLWIQKMADAGIAAGDMRNAFAGSEAARSDIPEVRHLRTPEGRVGLLSGVVVNRLESLPEGSLRQEDLDTLLVTERLFGPIGAAIQAGRFITVASHPGLREESDSVDAAEAALDDTVDVDDPRVTEVAAQRRAFELKLYAAMEASGLDEANEALFEEDLSGAGAEACTIPGAEQGTMSLVEAVGKMPYDFSPARLRCMELVEETLAQALGADSHR